MPTLQLSKSPLIVPTDGRWDPQRGYPPGSRPDRVYHAARRSVTTAQGVNRTGRLMSRKNVAAWYAGQVSSPAAGGLTARAGAVGARAAAGVPANVRVRALRRYVYLSP